LVSNKLPDKLAMWGLLHDAAEAYMGDMCHLIKLKLPAFREAECALLARIAKQFGLEGSIVPDLVSLTDKLLGYQEMGEAGFFDWWFSKPEKEIIGMPPEVAEAEFLKRFKELGGKING